MGSRADGPDPSDAGLGQGPGGVPDFLKSALSAVIASGAQDPAFAAQVLNFPGESDLARDIGQDVDPDAIHAARERLRGAMGRMLESDLRAVYEADGDRQPYAPDARGAGRRALRNTALSLLAAGDPGLGTTLARTQFEKADNMTDRLAALSVLTLIPGAAREADARRLLRHVQGRGAGDR